MRGLRGETTSSSPNRAAITATVITACVMQGLDTTIVNVCLPHIQGSMSAAQDQISWILTSYIVSSAIMMPLTGWLAARFGVKYIFPASVIGFTVASALCGAATSLTQLVLYRVLQGVCSAGLVPLGQTTLFTIYPRERHGYAMAIFSIGAMMGRSSVPPRRLADRQLRLALVLLHQPAGGRLVHARRRGFHPPVPHAAARSV